MEKTNTIKFIPGSRDKTLIIQELKQLVDYYFTSNSLSKKGDWRLYSKTIILVLSAVTHYYFLVIYPIPLSKLVTIVLLITAGFNAAFIGFNIMHDGGHGSYSEKEWINQLMGFSLNLLGGNILFWKKWKHNTIHHTNTNVVDADDDIKIIGMRIHPEDKWYRYYKYQYIYGPVLFYQLTYILWIIYEDSKKYISKFSEMSRNECWTFLITKITYGWIFIGYPMYKFGWSALSGYLLFASVCGLVIAIVFQLAHVVIDAKMVSPNEKNIVEEHWFIHQIQTTVDFATNSKILNWCIGGLNFQIEHHLFPRISHVHYPAIHKIFMKWSKKHEAILKEYEATPVVYKTLPIALGAHIKYLKKMGIEPEIKKEAA